MKVTCPNCKQVLQAPDKWAGKKVKCPSCKQPIALPGYASGTPDDLLIDLDSLGTIESGGETIIQERKGKLMTLKEAQAAAQAAVEEDTSPKKFDPTIRTCPQCGQKVKCDDLYSEVMCRHCSTGIPAPILEKGGTASYESGMSERVKTKVSFYTGFTAAFIYPIPGIASILMGMGIALGTIALPLFGILAFTATSSLNPAVEQEESSFGWVGPFLTVMFGLEGVYFGAVAYYAMIDTIRSTTSGSEQPPNLTWNILNLGAALAGYVTLILFYTIIILILLVLSNGAFPMSFKDLAALAKPINIAILALLTFIVPMNMIGLSSSHALDGLNPMRIGLSIGRLIGHYIFLFLIMIIYMGLTVGVLYALMSWAGPAIMAAIEVGIKEGILKLLGGLAAWAVVIGAALYFAYSIGRILGLFARSYREDLEFEI